MKSNTLFIGLIVVGAIIFFFVKNPGDLVKKFLPVENKPIVDSQKSPTSAPVVVGSKPASIAYTDALVKYKDRRIQFDKSCQAFPNTMTYKDNTGIMLDNRSPDIRTIKVGTTYTIPSYGFVIAVLPDIYLKSKTLLVDCDARRNVASIYIQE